MSSSGSQCVVPILDLGTTAEVVRDNVPAGALTLDWRGRPSVPVDVAADVVARRREAEAKTR
jgi:hypothetical protein